MLQGHSLSVLSVAFSRDGTRVVSGSWDKSVRVWNAVTGDVQRVFKGHWGVYSVPFSHDGTLVVSGVHDQQVRVWDVTTANTKRALRGRWFWKTAIGKTERVLEGHSEGVSSVAFSLNGTLVSGSWDNTVRIWNAVTGELERVLEGNPSPILSVAFSPSGTHVVSGSWDKSILIWDIITELVSLFYSESFQFPDNSKVTHVFPGTFQLFALDHPVISLSLDRKWILTDRPSEACWIPPNSATSIHMLFPALDCVLDANLGVSSLQTSRLSINLIF